MSIPYCGVNDPPKKHRRGTAKECAEKGQIRYYGLSKISKEDIVKGADKKTDPATRLNLLRMYAKCKGLISRNKGRYEGTKDKEKKEEYYKLWQDAEADLKKVLPKLKKIEAQISAEKAKHKEQQEKEKEKKSKAKSKTKKLSKKTK
jgi:hypothetical protein